MGTTTSLGYPANCRDHGPGYEGTHGLGCDCAPDGSDLAVPMEPASSLAHIGAASHDNETTAAPAATGRRS